VFQPTFELSISRARIYSITATSTPTDTHLKGHLFKLGLTDNPICERCLEDESATHILYECEAIAYLRFRHLGQFFMEPSDYYDAPINKVLHFTWDVGLIKGWSKRGGTREHWSSRCKGRSFWPTPYHYITLHYITLHYIHTYANLLGLPLHLVLMVFKINVAQFSIYSLLHFRKTNQFSWSMQKRRLKMY
jgi:hypothetical protein